MGVNAVLDLGFNFYFFGRLLPGLVILALTGITSFQSWFITLGHAVIVYGFQKWYEGETVRLSVFSLRPQQAAAKPIDKKSQRENEQ